MRGAREAGWGGLLPRLLSVDEDAFGATISYWLITPYPPLHTSFRTQMAYLYMNGRPYWSPTGPWSYWSLVLLVPIAHVVNRQLFHSNRQ
jgi:hypothetical protein